MCGVAARCGVRTSGIGAASASVPPLPPASEAGQVGSRQGGGGLLLGEGEEFVTEVRLDDDDPAAEIIE